MNTIRYIYWQDEDMWLGYLEEYPDYWAQGETMVQKNAASVHLPAGMMRAWDASAMRLWRARSSVPLRRSPERCAARNPSRLSLLYGPHVETTLWHLAAGKPLVNHSVSTFVEGGSRRSPLPRHARRFSISSA